jgi:hypothetical protein
MQLCGTAHLQMTWKEYKKINILNIHDIRQLKTVPLILQIVIKLVTLQLVINYYDSVQ